MGFYRYPICHHLGGVGTCWAVSCIPRGAAKCRGVYDESYIDYTIRIIRKCKQHGFKVCRHKPRHPLTKVISVHQDVFSRFCSGSGAPYWVLQAVGLSPRRIHQTGSAVIHACWATEGFGGEEGLQAAKEGTLNSWPDSEFGTTSARSSAVIWNTNTGRLASRHCFTMFWASDQYAPKCLIDGQYASDWLQRHQIAAYGQYVMKTHLY